MKQKKNNSTCNCTLIPKIEMIYSIARLLNENINILKLLPNAKYTFD